MVGMKFRAVYETPGGTVIMAAHRELEALCLDRETSYQKDVLGITYGQLIYDGHWFKPLRQALDAFFAKTQEAVTGSVTLSLCKGTMTIKSRKSPFSLYRQDMVSLDAGRYNPSDAGNFVELLNAPDAVRSRLMTKQYEALARTV